MQSGNPKLAGLLVGDPERAYAEIVKAVEGKHVSDAAKALGIDRRTLYRWFDEHPALEKACRKVVKKSRKKEA